MVPLPRLFDCSLECESAVSSLGNGNDRQPSASPPLGREAPVCFKPNRCSSEDSRGAFVAASLSLAAWVYSCHSYLFASSPHWFAVSLLVWDLQHFLCVYSIQHFPWHSCGLSFRAIPWRSSFDSHQAAPVAVAFHCSWHCRINQFNALNFSLPEDAFYRHVKQIVYSFYWKLFPSFSYYLFTLLGNVCLFNSSQYIQNEVDEEFRPFYNQILSTQVVSSILIFA